MLLFAIAAPNSIAGAQTAWLLGMFFWLLRFAVWPRPKLYRTPIDYPMFGFFLLTGISSFFSYEPAVSIGKLRAASLFLIVYLVAENLRSRKILRALPLVLVAACMLNVFYVFGRFAVGRGVRVQGVSVSSPLSQAWLAGRRQNQLFPILSGDTIEKIDGHSVRTADALAVALQQSNRNPARLQIYRYEWVGEVDVPRGRLLAGVTPEERLGIQQWSVGRDRRATGFFNNWSTYSESLQLIGSLALGLFAAVPRKRSRVGLALAASLAAIVGAILLSVTRASWLSLLLSGGLILALSLRRRAIILIGLGAIPLILAGLFVLQQKRNVGFFDRKDDSIAWRQKVWRDGFRLLTSHPRHLLVGIGMDSIKGHWRQWGLFENGRIPWGHMHSDYLQIALERGVPAFLVWLILLGTYARALWRTHRLLPNDAWIERGIVLGALGGLLGFMTSGIVHYNWGDSEVIMIFYLLMGLSLVVYRSATQQQSVNRP